MTDATTQTVDVQVLTAEALVHLNRGDFTSADQLLLRATEAAPEDGQVMQLLGVVRRYQGRLPEAEVLYRRSLTLDSAQPHVWHNLGTVLAHLGRRNEAAAAYREAIRLKANYVEAHLNLALALAESGNHEDAAKSCRAALRIQPNLLLARQILATELNELGKPREAEAVARQALALNPRDVQQAAALEHSLAMSLKQQERFDEALRYFDAAATTDPNLPAVDYNRANVLQHIGRLPEAAEVYGRAVARNPLDLSAHRQLNQLLYRLGDDEAFLKSYDEASARHPDVAQLPLDRAGFLLLREDYEGARGAFERACFLDERLVRAHDGLGLILARLGECDAAIVEHEIAVRLDPSDPFSWRNFAETLLRAGEARRALEAAERSLELDPNNQGAIAMWDVALRAAGDARAEALCDYENLVRPYEVRLPDGFADVESFNRELNAYLDGLHRDRREFIDQTLRKGTQTLGNIFGRDHAIVELLRASIDEAVADYVSRMKDESDHLLYKRKSVNFAYSASWSARLYDCGFHTNHVHPKGWISSAYYVALPDALEKPGTKEGWIKFGEPNFDCGLSNPIRKEVRPRVGTLVLFPSYMWHGTIPFQSTQSRTTIAFDVVPKTD
ncbi:MAG: tetratricopeptide repeat protein [Rhizomicrobium sp.]|jgi:tetratricopeptide (TPR) repeat protein